MASLIAVVSFSVGMIVAAWIMRDYQGLVWGGVAEIGSGVAASIAGPIAGIFIGRSRRRNTST